AQILLNSSNATIPIINAEIPVVILFLVGPGLLLVLYVSFQFYMHRLWEMIADLPAIFPDGLAMPRKTFPWLFNELGRGSFPHLRRNPQSFSRVQDRLFWFLSYLLIPLTMVIFWARYLVRHDWWGTGWHAILLGMFFGAVLVFAIAAHCTLCRHKEET